MTQRKLSSFSEEKEAKRLLSFRSSPSGARHSREGGAGTKVFLLLFLQKKKKPCFALTPCF
jgi:hypothetical protein